MQLHFALDLSKEKDMLCNCDNVVEDRQIWLLGFSSSGLNYIATLKFHFEKKMNFFLLAVGGFFSWFVQS